MDPRHLDELIRLEESYWWHVAKRRLALALLERFAPPPGRVVEGGIGSGRQLLACRDQGYSVSGFDVLPAAVLTARERGLDDVRLHDVCEPWPLRPASVRAVLLLDVLEHLPDPLAALQHATRALEPGGAVVLTVPACPWLFGEWDRVLGHHRRYTARELRRQAREAGFHVELLKHWNSFTLPAAIAVRGCERLRGRRRAAEFPRVHPITNRLLLRCADLERRLIGFAPVPCGLSLVAVLRKCSPLAPRVDRPHAPQVVRTEDLPA
jgi:SAM-dependent methyltransferase